MNGIEKIGSTSDIKLTLLNIMENLLIDLDLCVLYVLQFVVLEGESQKAHCYSCLYHSFFTTILHSAAAYQKGLLYQLKSYPSVVNIMFQLSN